MAFDRDKKRENKGLIICSLSELVYGMHPLLLMKKNVGSKERYARIAVGAVSGLAAGFVPMSWAARIGLFLLGFAGLGTGISQYCPVNQWLGVDRYHPKPEPQSIEELKKKAA